MITVELMSFLLILTVVGAVVGDEPPDDDNRIDDNFDIESKNYLS